MGGQTSKGSSSMKERSAPARQGDSIVKYRLHGKIGGGGPEAGGERTQSGAVHCVFFLKSAR